MADDNQKNDDDEDLDDDLTSGLEKKKFSGKKMVIFGAAGLLLVSGLAGGAYFFLAGDDEDGEHVAEGENGEGIPAQVFFYDLPDILVNLNTGGRKASYLKARISLEISDEASIPELEQHLPRILDRFQVFLRDVRLEDLEGSAGMYRLKEELLRRINASVAPTMVNDILFRELLVQ